MCSIRFISEEHNAVHPIAVCEREWRGDWCPELSCDSFLWCLSRPCAISQCGLFCKIKIDIDFSFISEETCNHIVLCSESGTGRKVAWPLFALFLSIPSVGLKYCTTVRVYSKAVVCRLLSVFHLQWNFVRGIEGLTEHMRRRAVRKVSKSHYSGVTQESLSISGSLFYFFSSWFISALIPSAATQLELQWCW